MALSKAIILALAVSITAVQASPEATIAISCKNGQDHQDTTVYESGFLGSKGCTPVSTQSYNSFQIRSVTIDDNEECYVSVYDWKDQTCSGHTIIRVGPFKKGQNGLACADLGTDPVTGAHDNGGPVIMNCHRI